MGWEEIVQLIITGIPLMEQLFASIPQSGSAKAATLTTAVQGAVATAATVTKGGTKTTLQEIETLVSPVINGVVGLYNAFESAIKPAPVVAAPVVAAPVVAAPAVAAPVVAAPVVAAPVVAAPVVAAPVVAAPVDMSASLA